MDEFAFEEGSDESTPPYRFRIKLSPNPDGENNHGDVLTSLLVLLIVIEKLFYIIYLVALDLVCSMPNGYPEETLPDVSLDIKKGISDKQKPEVEELISTQAEENLGCASIYIIAEAVREWLVDNNVEGQVLC